MKPNNTEFVVSKCNNINKFGNSFVHSLLESSVISLGKRAKMRRIDMYLSLT